MGIPGHRFPTSLGGMPIRKLLAAGLFAASALAVAAPATAATAATTASEDARDPARDVLSGPYFTDDLPTKAEPARRRGDITRTTVTLGSDLVVTTRFRDLTPIGEQEFQWFIATSEDDFYWTADLTLLPGRDKGHFTLIDPLANQPGCGQAVLDRPGRTVTLTIPATCLGSPSWVRVGNGAIFFKSETQVFWDDARRDAGIRHGWKFGPKVTG